MCLIQTYGEVKVEIHVFFTSELVGGEWSASRHGSFAPEERASGGLWIGVWVEPRTVLDYTEERKVLKLP
jgi:hypothetical protein